MKTKKDRYNKSEKKCKSCKGTGRILKGMPNESGMSGYGTFRYSFGKKVSRQGEVCKRCHGRGVV